MFETDEQVEELQQIIDRSFERSGRYLQSIVEPEKRLSARQVVRQLEGICIIAVATVSSRGEPRISSVDGHFLWGRFWFGTGGSALKARHLRRNAAISVSYFRGDEVAITVHGTATLFGRDSEEGEALRSHFTDVYGSDPYTWTDDDIAWVRVEPQSIITYAPDAASFPE